MRAKASLIKPQARFLALPQRFRAYVAGYRAGKTWAGCAGLCRHFWMYPRAHCGYFAPNYQLIRDIFFPTIDEVAIDWGLRTEIRLAAHEVDFYKGRVFLGTTICRSLENPGKTIIGFKIARALVDELDILDQAKARLSWDKIAGRLSLSFDGQNGIDVMTTPEGFRFTYDRFYKSVLADPKLAQTYGLIQASTYDNAKNLPTDYISNLLSTYSADQANAYLRGQFVNLQQGTVYNQFNRMLNGSDETIRKGEPLHIGMDFNVGKMAAVVHVMRDGNPHAVDEIMHGYDTPDMIQKIQSRFDGHSIRVHPDASGGSRKSENAASTDIQLLKEAGFTVSAPSANPAVRDRINAMNAMFCNAKGERRYRVNVSKCPVYASSLEQQAYTDKGEPDKRHDEDHPNDAAGYFIHRMFPLRRPVTSLKLGIAT